MYFVIEQRVIGFSLRCTYIYFPLLFGQGSEPDGTVHKQNSALESVNTADHGNCLTKTQHHGVQARTRLGDSCDQRRPHEQQPWRLLNEVNASMDDGCAGRESVRLLLRSVRMYLP